MYILKNRVLSLLVTIMLLVGGNKVLIGAPGDEFNGDQGKYKKNEKGVKVSKNDPIKGKLCIITRPLLEVDDANFFDDNDSYESYLGDLASFKTSSKHRIINSKTITMPFLLVRVDVTSIFDGLSNEEALNKSKDDVLREGKSTAWALLGHPKLPGKFPEHLFYKDVKDLDDGDIIELLICNKKVENCRLCLLEICHKESRFSERLDGKKMTFKEALECLKKRHDEYKKMEKETS